MAAEVRPELTLMHRVRKVHFVGIGGAGMSGIAEVLLNLGFGVSGSDLADNQATRHLAALGAMIHRGHNAGHITDADVVVTSSAIAADNPEVAAAQDARVPVVRRAEMLGELMRFRHGIAVAGTHGKTTTTSLVASLLAAGGMDPTFIIGGRVNAFGSHARLGQGRYLVAEADESDGSFLLLQPVISLVTNIDRDHLGAFEGSFDTLQRAFGEFLHHLPFYGLAVLCIDDPHVAELVPETGRRILTYGLSEAADVRATDIVQRQRNMDFNLHLPDGETRSVSIALPGRHNVQNALGAATVAWELGMSSEAIAHGLAGFSGIARRFADLGEVSLAGRRVQLIEDYGHHPSELEAVLAAARGGWPDKRIVLVFQPHRYSRTRDLFDAFVRVLCEPDVLVLSAVYAAGEAPITGMDSAALARAIVQRGRPEPVLVDQITEIPPALADVAADGDLVLLMGAGDIGRVGAMLQTGDTQ